MSANASTTSEATLTPSETVLLHAERFAAKDTAFTVGEDLLLRGGKVSANSLSQALLATALLANEQQGSLRLEIQVKPALFGLLKRRHLMAVPTSGGPAWTAGTLEAACMNRLAGGAVKVGELVYDMLEADRSSPAGIAPQLVKRGLGARGLLESKTTKTLRVFTTSSWAPSPGLEALARRRGADAERELLRACEAERSEVWEALKKEIGSAISRRTESTDHDHD